MQLRVDWNRAFDVAWRILVFVVAVGIIFVVTTNWTRWEGGAGWQRTDDAFLQADLTPIAVKVAGYVRELPLQDYQRVHQGEVLARLVDDDFRAALTQAQAGVDTARAQAGILRAQHALQLANIGAARAVVAATRAAVAQNVRDQARQQRLLDTGSSSIEDRKTRHRPRRDRGATRAARGAGARRAAPTRGHRRPDRRE
jgi:membrane fusion protein (multidrug efflux system)